LQEELAGNPRVMLAVSLAKAWPVTVVFLFVLFLKGTSHLMTTIHFHWLLSLWFVYKNGEWWHLIPLLGSDSASLRFKRWHACAFNYVNNILECVVNVFCQYWINCHLYPLAKYCCQWTPPTS
jgi:hypothetical protein